MFIGIYFLQELESFPNLSRNSVRTVIRTGKGTVVTSKTPRSEGARASAFFEDAAASFPSRRNASADTDRVGMERAGSLSGSNLRKYRYEESL